MTLADLRYAANQVSPANRALIAAAPDLLDTLEVVAGCANSKSDGLCPTCKSAVREAIKKARGEQ